MINNFKRTLEELNAKALNSITFAFGAIFIINAILIGLEKAIGIILVSIGTSIIASSIVVYLSSKYLFKQNRIKDIIDIWGLRGIFNTRAEMNLSTNENLENNEICLDIIAFGLRNFRDNKGDFILKKVAKGMKVRILTMDPESKFLKQREIDEGVAPGETKHSIMQLIQWAYELNQYQIRDGQVQIKIYDSLPQDFYFGMDNAIYVGPYLYGIISQQTISYEYTKNSKGYDYYSNYFEKLWNNKLFAKELSYRNES